MPSRTPACFRHCNELVREDRNDKVHVDFIGPQRRPWPAEHLNRATITEQVASRLGNIVDSP